MSSRLNAAVGLKVGLLTVEATECGFEAYYTCIARTDRVNVSRVM